VTDAVKLTEAGTSTVLRSLEAAAEGAVLTVIMSAVARADAPVASVTVNVAL
jgi:hypothetical protein